MHKMRWRVAGIWLLCAAMITGLFVTGVLNKQKVWPGVAMDFVGGDNLWRLEDGDAYGRVASGPYVNLPVGMYRIKWQIEGDGENRIVLSSSNDARITPGEIALHPGLWQDEAWFEIKDHTHSFSIHVYFDAGTRLQVHNIRLYSPQYTDNALAVSAGLFMLCLLLTLKLCGRLNAQDLRELVLLAAAVLIASQPCLGENSPIAYDTHFHTARIVNLADGIRSGMLPVRVGGFSYNGYGAATSVFYPDLLLYPWALALLGGASMTFVINSLVITVNAFSAWCMMIAGRRMTGSRQAAVCAGVLYALSVYRLDNLYSRFALGEMLAMAFLPLFLLGLYEVVLGDQKRWPVLVLGATLIFRSHMLTTVLCALCALALGGLFFVRILRERRLGAIMLACIATLLVNLNQIVPMLIYYAQGVNTPAMQFGFAEFALDFSELLQVDRYLGFALIIGTAAFVCAQEKENSARRVMWLLLYAGLGCTVLATEIIPWSHISKLTGGAVDILQFPWRFLLLACACFSLCGGDGIRRLMPGDGMQAAAAALVVAAVCAFPYMNETAANTGRMELGHSTSTYMDQPEYQIEGTDVGDTRSRTVIVLGDALVTDYEKDGTRIRAQLQVRDAAAVEFPLFGFPGYAAKLDGEEIDWRLGSNNRLTVDLPAGAEGLLEICYKGMPVCQAMDVLSGAAVLALGLWVFFEKKRRSA